MRSCGGLHGQYLAEPLADIHVLQVTSAGFRLEAGRQGHGRDKGKEASDSIGTLHVAHWVPFEHNHMGFFTIFDGDMEKYFQDFADKTSFVFDALFPHVDGAPPTPVAKNAQAFYQWGLDNNYPAIGFYSAYPGLSVQDIRALLADLSRTRPPRALSVADRAMFSELESALGPAMRPGLFAGGLVERLSIGGRWRFGEPRSRRSTSRTFRGSFSALTECRWCGISC